MTRIAIIAHVATNTFSNAVNRVFDTDVDLPRVDASAA
jgi:hypothetical protein